MSAVYMMVKLESNVLADDCEKLNDLTSNLLNHPCIEDVSYRYEDALVERSHKSIDRLNKILEMIKH